MHNLRLKDEEAHYEHILLLKDIPFCQEKCKLKDKKCISQPKYNIVYSVLNIKRKKRSNLMLISTHQNIVIDGHVVSKKLQFLSHVLEQSSHHRSQMNNVCRFVFIKDSSRLDQISKIPFFARQKDPFI